MAFGVDMAEHYRIVVGLSGGVDSAVTAWLLKKAGHEVVGIFMKNWEDDDDDAYCSSRQDFLDAASVADVLGIAIEHVNFSREYRDRVFAEFLTEYQAGRTPNPDIFCNSEIKFRAFLDHAMRLGAEKIATGHYARVRHNAKSGLFELLKGTDVRKDQSYFLHRLNQQQLSKSLFPLGEYEKTTVRQMATEAGLPNAGKKDSTGICFIGERPFRAFLNRYIAAEAGAVKDPEGNVVGKHMGLSFYTIGQRHGLGIGGIRRTHEQNQGKHLPWFVARKDMDSNTLWAVQGHDHPWLLSQTVNVANMSWCGGAAPAAGRYTAKTRYRQSDADCTLRTDGASVADGGWQAHFDARQWAVTPGQSLVLYDGDLCLGGGIIQSAH